MGSVTGEGLLSWHSEESPVRGDYEKGTATKRKKKEKPEKGEVDDMQRDCSEKVVQYDLPKTKNIAYAEGQQRGRKETEEKRRGKDQEMNRKLAKSGHQNRGEKRKGQRRKNDSRGKRGGGMHSLETNGEKGTPSQLHAWRGK